MAKRKAGWAVLGGLLFLTPWVWADQADFSGTWVLNQQKSDAANPRGGQQPDITMMIEQSGGALKISQKVTRGGNERTFDFTYTTDGEAREIRSVQGSGPARAKWDGDKLAVRSVQKRRTPRGEMEVESAETWKLSPDGKVLTVISTMKTPRGERTRKMVYDKQ